MRRGFIGSKLIELLTALRTSRRRARSTTSPGLEGSPAAPGTLLASPPASAALVAMGRPGLSFMANVVSTAVLFPLLPLLMLELGLVGAGCYVILQAMCGSAMLSALLWRLSRSHRPP